MISRASATASRLISGGALVCGLRRHRGGWAVAGWAAAPGFSRMRAEEGAGKECGWPGRTSPALSVLRKDRARRHSRRGSWPAAPKGTKVWKGSQGLRGLHAGEGGPPSSQSPAPSSTPCGSLIRAEGGGHFLNLGPFPSGPRETPRYWWLRGHCPMPQGLRRTMLGTAAFPGSHCLWPLAPGEHGGIPRFWPRSGAEGARLTGLRGAGGGTPCAAFIHCAF